MTVATATAAAAVVAVAAALFAATFWFEQMPEGITRGFGAELFPRMVLGTIIGLAILLALTPASDAPLPRIPRMVWYSGASLLAFMALVPVVGMLPTMFVFLVALGILWGERRYVLARDHCGFADRGDLGRVRQGLRRAAPEGLFA